ncbi:adenosylhomocysteine nucleosidase [Microdochium nivale]|nr:adenosylhomocysteine nucleosidase [Microdochium nivale]
MFHVRERRAIPLPLCSCSCSFSYINRHSGIEPAPILATSLFYTIMPSNKLQKLAATDYTVAWICPLYIELTAAKRFLDETHEPLDTLPRDDDNTYELGRIGEHNVVLIALDTAGLVPATTAVMRMAQTFPEIRFALAVGIGGGAPTQSNDIRLGDVVVSSPGRQDSGVIHYDLGKQIQGGGFRRTGTLNLPPRCLQTAIQHVRSYQDEHGNGIERLVEETLIDERLRKKYGRPDPRSDVLFQSHYIHIDESQDCEDCSCDTALIARRCEREAEDSIVVHYGLIASGNAVIRDAQFRDTLAATEGVLCVEMEAAGLMNNLPCLVIRGICDYSDSHKNKNWQGYAAMTAAAYAKQVLERVRPSTVRQEQKLVDMLNKA